MTILNLPIIPTQTTQPNLLWRTREGSLLRPSPLSPPGEVMGLNLARGCSLRCAFCTARAYPTYPGDEVVVAYEDTVERLRSELARMHRLPRAVFLCPSTDPFPASEELQQLTVEVIEVLAEYGVEAWLMTRGQIHPSTLEALVRHREHVKVTVALTTLDESLSRVLEPGAASPRQRLQQLAQLQRRGVRVQAALDPLLPGVTDTRENLEAVLDALHDAGIRHVSAGYLFLRDGIADNLRTALEPLELAEVVLNEYRGGPFLTPTNMQGGRYLPKARRQHGYARLMALAASREIQVTISSTSNPDFTATRRTTGTISPRSTLLSAFVAAGR